LLLQTAEYPVKRRLRIGSILVKIAWRQKAVGFFFQLFFAGGHHYKTGTRYQKNSFFPRWLRFCP
jgi:hypothetical protein